MNTISIKNCGISLSGGNDLTNVLQSALDTAAASGGGTVSVPSGTNGICGALKIGPRTALRMEPGSLLLACPDVKAYSETPQGKFWIRAEDAQDVRIEGTGTLDGNGRAFMKEFQQYHAVGMPLRPRILGFFGCKNVSLQDVTLRDAADWAVHPCGCDGVNINGITILNDLRIPNCDGIDPDHCRNVRISNCHIEAGDDGIVIKTRKEWNKYGACENITVTNCTVISTSCALKIGTETAQDIRNVTFQNCVVDRSNRGLAICHRDAGTLENIIFSNIIVRTRRFHETWWGQAEPLYVTALPRSPGVMPGPLRNVTFNNITAEAENGIFLMGMPEQPVSRLTIDGLNLTIQKTSRWPVDCYDLRPCPPDIMPRNAQPRGEVTPWGCLAQRPVAACYAENIRGLAMRNCCITTAPGWPSPAAQSEMYNVTPGEQPGLQVG